MSDTIEKHIDEYFKWLKDRTVISYSDDVWHEVTTPHLDRHNDCLQFYVRFKADGLELSDAGYIINDLLSSGCELDTPKRKELLMTTLAGFGVGIDSKKALHVDATKENFPLKKHSLLQAMMAVNDLFYLATPHVASLFREDVENWLMSSDIRYTPNIKFTGKSGYDHMFDFVIPMSKNLPERIVQTITNPQKNTAESLVFKWMDTRETRSGDSTMYALLNDKEHNISSSVVDALKNYDLRPIKWSERDEVKEELAA